MKTVFLAVLTAFSIMVSFDAGYRIGRRHPIDTRNLCYLQRDGSRDPRPGVVKSRSQFESGITVVQFEDGHFETEALCGSDFEKSFGTFLREHP